MRSGYSIVQESAKTSLPFGPTGNPTTRRCDPNRSSHCFLNGPTIPDDQRRCFERQGHETLLHDEVGAHAELRVRLRRGTDFADDAEGALRVGDEVVLAVAFRD